MIAPLVLAIATVLPCAHRHGEQFIVCRESAGNPKYLADGAPHPGKSSASGAYGLLSATRRDFGRGCSTDRCIATRYMRSRYGSWAAAERAHRAKGWW